MTRSIDNGRDEHKAEKNSFIPDGKDVRRRRLVKKIRELGFGKPT
jgi:hypothetical protein